MLILRGGLAATPYRLQQQFSTVHSLAPSINALQAHWIYFVEKSGVLPSEQIGLLRSLLNVEEALSGNSKLDNKVIVSPRIGTISPWSSKATDIIGLCGLEKTGRIERGVIYTLPGWSSLDDSTQKNVLAELHDRMTQEVFTHLPQVQKLFAHQEPKPVSRLTSLESLENDIQTYNTDLGLALSNDEVDYLVKNYTELGRCPTDVELMMFAQANSEHCRHKIFNASWTIDNQPEEQTLFGMVRTTYNNAPDNVLSAYKDNAAVMAGHQGRRFYPNQDSVYQYNEEDIHILMKVETHNHPTAISPYPGAATGSGGEIRDEGATGRGGYPKAGLCGFSVSGLKLPELNESWEINYGKPDRIVSALDIMVEGPIGAAAFNNEFGRPNLLGYFRSYEQEVEGVVRGYHKPIMIAGGMGNIRADDVEKKIIPEGTPIIVLGGPAMLIGLGGGAASSMASGSSDAQLDFASVQRENPEMERRCQEVINHCWGLQTANPILSIHDVGAGGLSNALPEILDDSDRGGQIELRAIPNAEPGMSPMEIWCNEAQERYVLAIEKDKLDMFIRICERERCLYAVVGHATQEQTLVVNDATFDNQPIDIPMQVLLGKPPKVSRDTSTSSHPTVECDYSNIDIAQVALQVLRHPTVACKKFLITIGDRTVTGQVARDQMVGPWQVPVADVAVTASGFQSYTGEAMAMGERTPLAVTSGPHSARMALGEALTNLMAADIRALEDIRLSANWMAAANYMNEDSRLYSTVKALTDICRALNIAIPVGKDSLSMQTVWQEQGVEKKVVAPVSLIISAFAPATDVRQTWTPQLRHDRGESYLMLIDLGRKASRLGGSILSEVIQGQDTRLPDTDEQANDLINYFNYISQLRDKINVLSYHDRSDGGLWVTLCEMAFAGRCGLNIQVQTLGNDPVASLFAEELGAVLQIAASEIDQAVLLAKMCGLEDCIHILGQPTRNEDIVITYNNESVINQSRATLEQQWSQVSYQIQKHRDHSRSAKEEFSLITDPHYRGLQAKVTFDCDEDVTAPYISRGVKPKIAVLREQGVNGHIEMAAAFERAGFDSVDVHMTDLIHDRHPLNEFQALVACGGFSYGDVLGAGSGWASNILYNSKLKDIFQAFFNRDDVLALGVCNGCQMMSQLKSIIPGAQAWPRFLRNDSEQFEARLVNVEVLPSHSCLLAGMQGSVLPIAVAHGEGRISSDTQQAQELMQSGQAALRYVDSQGAATEHYPLNPNGSALGITALTNEDGRFTIMMPHPERLFRSVQYSWHPQEWRENGPWLRMFRNARVALN